VEKKRSDRLKRKKNKSAKGWNRIRGKRTKKQQGIKK
jgi:hypothetical protein